MFDLWVPIFESIQIEQYKIFILDSLADGDVITSGGDCNTLYWFYLIWKFDELHGFIFEWLLNDDFTHSVYHFHLAVFFNDADLVFGLEGKVRAESMVKI